MYSVQVDQTLLWPGFPIRKSTDIMPAFGSPWLIVDRYVLHRLLVPRHPLCALSSLTMQSDRLLSIRIMLVHNFAILWILLSCIVQQYEIIVLPIIFFLSLHYIIHCSVFKVHFPLLRVALTQLEDEIVILR